MKKLLSLSLSLSLFILISILSPSKVHAIDFTVGATTWYTWWDLNRDGGKIDIAPAFLYGPALAVKFNDDFNLTCVYLYGEFNLNKTAIYHGKTFSKIRRQDFDLALNYRLNNYFKIFAGVKNINYKYVGIGDYGSMGPALGLSAICPLNDNLFLIANLSGYYHPNGEETGPLKEYGMNSTLTLAYYIASASTTISLGGRFQHSKTDYDDSTREPTKQTFYGITLTATYTF